MAVLNDSIVQGDLRVIGNLYANISGKSTSAVSAEKAASATKALQDSYGTTINASSYKTKQTASSWTGGTTGKTITAIHQNANGDITAINTGNITFPTVNNQTVTIQKNGTYVTSFKLNDSSATTANITVPTALSQITSAHTHATGDITNLTGITVAKAKDLENSAFYNHSGNIWSGVSATVQSEINNKIAGVYQIQGDAVWSAISANNDNKKNGYVYNITGGVDGNSKDRNNNVISIGDNVVYIASSNKASAGWDKLASTLNTDNFALKNGTYTATNEQMKVYSAISAATAGYVAWANVNGRPTGLSSFNDSASYKNSNLSGYKTIKFGSNTFNGAGSVGSTLEITASTNIAFVNSAANKIGISAKEYTSLNSVNSSQYGNLTAVSASYTANSANMLSGSSALVKAGNLSAESLNLNGDASVNTLHANELVVDGAARVLGTLYADTIEGKITSATNADKALDSDKLGNVAASNYVQKSTSVTLTASNATNATNALNVMTQTATNGSAYQATTAMFSGTSAKSALTAYKEQWSLAPNTVNKERPLALSNDNDTIIGGTAGVNGISFNTNITFNSSANRLKVTNLSATNITGTVLETGSLLPASANLNDYKNNKRGEVAWYNYVSNGTEGNRPENGTSVLQVIKKHDGDYVDQNVYVAGVAGYYWHRSCINGTWGNWVKNVYSPTIPAAQIQSDWNQTDTSKLDYIKNKPSFGTMTGKNSGDYISTAVDSVKWSNVSALTGTDASHFAKGNHTHGYISTAAGSVTFAQVSAITGTGSSNISRGDHTHNYLASVAWKDVSGLTGTGATNLAVGNHTHNYISNSKDSVTWSHVSANGGTTSAKFALGNHTHSNSGNYLSASYATATTSTFSGTAATAKNLYVNEHSTNDTTYYPIWANGAGNSNRAIYTTSAKLQFNPKSGQLYVSDKMKVGGCTMTWNASTSALDFTF